MKRVRRKSCSPSSQGGRVAKVCVRSGGGVTGKDSNMETVSEAHRVAANISVTWLQLVTLHVLIHTGVMVA